MLRAMHGKAIDCEAPRTHMREKSSYTDTHARWLDRPHRERSGSRGTAVRDGAAHNVAIDRASSPAPRARCAKPGGSACRQHHSGVRSGDAPGHHPWLCSSSMKAPYDGVRRASQYGSTVHHAHEGTGRSRSTRSELSVRHSDECTLRIWACMAR
ncbi:hypothetical protein BV20DRAFT_130300 [Pilatotrama ljubarskyi]|nr:hypothetical protein BV20DRAFT_130300 [Pilatotrama ljubarskyi]